MIVTAVVVAAIALALVIEILVTGRGFETARPGDSPWVAETAPIEKHVEVDGCRLRVLDTEGGGPVLVLLHGWADSTFTWRAIIPRLRSRFRLIAIDWPGFGFSDKPPRPTPFPALARTAVAVLDKLGVDSAFVAGNSMGGAAAIQLAFDIPARVRGLIVIDAHTPFSIKVRNPALNVLRYRGAGEAAVALIGRAVFGMVVRGLVHDRALITRDVVREMYLPLATPGGRMALLRQFREITARVWPWETAARVTAPTLIIWGRRDHLTPRKAGEKLNQVIAGSTLAVLDDTGHLPQWERPDDVARLIGEFIERAAGRPFTPAAGAPP